MSMYFIPGQRISWDGRKVKGGKGEVIQSWRWQGKSLDAGTMFGIQNLLCKTKHLTWSKAEICFMLSLAAVSEREERAEAASPKSCPSIPSKLQPVRSRESREEDQRTACMRARSCSTRTVELARERKPMWRTAVWNKDGSTWIKGGVGEKGVSCTSVNVSPAKVSEWRLEVCKLPRIISTCSPLNPLLLKPTTFRWHTALVTLETLSYEKYAHSLWTLEIILSFSIVELQKYLAQWNRVQV